MWPVSDRHSPKSVSYCLRQWVWIVLLSRAFGGRRMKTLPAVAALLIGHAVVGADTHEASAQGHTRTGNEMLPVCRAFLESPGLFEHATAEQALRAGFCGGYIAGILSESTEACVPPVSTREAVRTVVEYLETHSEQLNNDFDDLVESALRATWPCPSTQEP